MMKRSKRLLACITAIAMCFTMIGSMPMSVSAQPDAGSAVERQKVQNGTEGTAKEKQAAIEIMDKSGTARTAAEDNNGSGSSEVTVYFTLSDDGKFVTGKDNDETLMCHVPITVEYFDLKDYGLEDFYRYKSKPAEEGGGYNSTEVIKQPTLLHLYIKAIETYYLGGQKLDLQEEDSAWNGGDALTITGSATSMFMKKFWGHDENLMYYVDHSYPLQTEGWGATADYILLENDMEIDVAMFTDWDFYNTGAFASFSPTMKTVKTGEKFKLQMAGSSTSMNSIGDPLVMKNEDIVYAKKNDTYGGNSNDNWDKWDGVTDSSGNITMSFSEPGTYYVSSSPLYDTFQSLSGNPCVAPPVAVIEVTGEAKEDDAGTENLTVLSNLYFKDTASSSGEKYRMNADFKSGTGSYIVYVPDNKDTISVWAETTDEAKAVSAKSKLNISYTDKSGAEQEKSKTISESAGQAIPGIIAAGEKDASCTITAVCGKSSQEYSIDIRRIPTLSDLKLSCSDTAASLDKTFSGSVYEYTVSIPESEKTLDLELSPFSDKYTVKVNNDPVSSGKYSLDLSGEQNIVVSVTGTNGETSEYKITIAYKVKNRCIFNDLLEGTTVCVTDNTGESVLNAKASSDGASLEAKNFLEDCEYRYSITKKGYVGKSGTITVGAEDITVDGKLTAAEKNNSIDPSIESSWADFRGNAANNGVTDAKTPVKASDTQLMWAVKNGDGWSGAPSSPIIVDNDIVFSTGREIVKVDRVTGEVKKRGTMAFKSTFSLTPPTYAEGMIFIALADGMVQAFDAKTLESLWLYKDPQRGQPNSPITYKDGYIYTGFWNSEIRTANYVCLSVTDEDPGQTQEEKTAAWTHSHKGGFYWAGACAADNAIIVGSEDGSDVAATGTLYSFDPQTGSVIDTIDDIKGDIRSTVVYDSDTGRYCFTSSGGVFYTVALNKDGSFDKAGITALKLHPVDAQGNIDESASGQSSSTPVIHNGRAYVGVTKAGKGLTAYAGHNVTVIDIAKNETAYCVPTRGYPQASGVLTSGYENSDGYSYIYFVENYTPGIMRIIKDKKGQTKPEYDRVNNGGILGEDKEDVNYADTLFTPRGEQAEYAICSPIVDEYGTIYFRNDSSYMMALGSKVEKIEITKQPDKTKYNSGDVFDPTGMEVTAYLANGLTRDVTDYVTYSTDPITDNDLEIEVKFTHVMYNDKEKKSDLPADYISISSASEAEREAVRNTSSLIDAIADAEDYAAKKAAAEKARASYDDLGAKLQDYVQNLDKLIEAETEIADKELKDGTETPMIKVSQVSYNEQKLTWNINEKADGYVIYRSQTEGELGSAVKTVKDKNTLSANIGTTTGTVYYYTLRPYILVGGEPAGDLYSQQVSGKTVLTAPAVKASSYSYKSIKLTWNKVTGAQGYKVYRYSSKSKKYLLLKTITSGSTVSYTNSSLTTGTTYSYRVAAYRGSSIGSQSKTASTSPKLSTPTSFKVKAGKKSASVSWKKTTGASGYVIYRSTKSKSGFKTVKTITKSSTVKYTNKSLKKGRTYYYKMRAYRKVGSKKVYSSYTKTLKIKAK